MIEGHPFMVKTDAFKNTYADRNTQNAVHHDSNYNNI